MDVHLQDELPIVLLFNGVQCMLPIDSPIDIPGADPKKCYFPSSNKQFEYDRTEISEAILTKEMGLVSNRLNTLVSFLDYVGTLHLQDADFGRPLVSYCEELLSQTKTNKSRALVLGCGPGYSTFLLTRTFSEVTLLCKHKQL